MTKTTQELNILITPDQTIIAGEVIHPTSINIVLENGHSYELIDTIKLLEIYDKKKRQRKPFFSRTRRLISAVKQVLKEESEHPHDNPQKPSKSA
jgi:hypothetical protein